MIHTSVNYVGSLVLGICLGVAGLAWWPDITAPWRELNEIKAPIQIPDAEAHWVNERQFDITAPAYVWSDTCPVIWSTWWVQTRRYGNVLVSSRVLDGPFKDRGTRPPNYRVSVKPYVGDEIRIRVTIPDWLSRDEVQLIAVDDVVPDNEPCVSGWTGVMELFRLQVNPERRGTVP